MDYATSMGTTLRYNLEVDTSRVTETLEVLEQRLRDYEAALRKADAAAQLYAVQLRMMEPQLVIPESPPSLAVCVAAVGAALCASPRKFSRRRLFGLP